MAKFIGTVRADPLEKKRKRFKAWLAVDNGFLPNIQCKKFPTRRAATEWLAQRRVENPYQF